MFTLKNTRNIRRNKTPDKPVRLMLMPKSSLLPVDRSTNWFKTSLFSPNTGKVG